jgi:hypothetical protein
MYSGKLNFGEKREKVSFLMYGTTRFPFNLAKKYSKILIFCKKGKDLNELKKMEIKELNFVISALAKNKLLKKIGAKYVTTFPIVISEDYRYVRMQIRPIIRTIVPAIENNLIKLKEEHEDYIYVIFFSLILDDIVWKILEKEGYAKTVERVMREERGYRGYLWGIEPIDFRCGTMVSRHESTEIKNFWSTNTPITRSPYFIKKNLMTIVNFLRIKKIGAVNDIKLIKDENIVAIIMNKRGSTYSRCHQIAKEVAGILKKMNIKKIDRRLKIHNQYKTFCIVYHELMWSLLEALESKKIIKKPTDIDRIVYLIVK